ncbi:MAG: hypothetical protein E6J91_42200 [Deltaproteobacteria bacterium]|nr:MAG: hypothetical protein E6J91_42200 [Deltaproteobacteria bacterium]
MTEPAAPARGHMVLYDRMDLPLPPGDYQVHVETTVALAGATLPPIDRHLRIEGPRFRLAPTEVAGVFPPRNARGPFTDAMPHVALGRRTLPWERTADPAGTLRLPDPLPGGPPPPTGAPPWLALLLFDETEAPEVTVLPNRKVVDVLPAAVRARLAPPGDATCDAIEVDSQLLRQLLPSLEELHLLAHVRQVNIEDRELSAGDSDGWFAVVVCARVPLPDRKYRACLVSLEGRTDLIQVTPPPVASDVIVVGPPHGAVIGAAERLVAALPAAGTLAVDFTPIERIFRFTSQLILLHSWTFECTGTGTFQALAEHLDVGMIGDVRGDWPKITDTGHLAMPLRSRAGSEETVWYRGPLVAVPISRDTRGPYHSADQARRISLDTGLEDISYAAAFEVGRLLAAADARLAQELMRWRRGDYRRSFEARLRAVIRDRFPVLLERFRLADLTADLLGRWQGPRVRYIDPAEGRLIDRAPGLDAANLAVAWGLSAERAAGVLSIDAAALAGTLERPADTRPGVPPTIDGVARDAAALGRLAGARERLAPSAIDERGFYTGGLR